MLLVAIATLVGLLIAPHWGTSSVVLLYLPPVLASAVWLGLGPALLAAMASTLAFNYYFTEPVHTFTIRSPADVMTVVILFLVALVTSHLTGSMREQAQLAKAHAARNSTIAGFARRLLSCPGEVEIAEVAVRELAALFDCHAVLLSGPSDPRILASHPGEVTLAPSDFVAATVALTTDEPTGRGMPHGQLADWQFWPVTANHTTIAVVGLARIDGNPPVTEDRLPLLANLLDQTALALERARLEREARDVAALRERFRLRSALLASIGQDVKPRIAAILGVARELRRAGSSDRALVSTISAEAAKLDRYIENLVDIDPGSEPEPIAIGPVTIDLARRRVSRDGAEVSLTPKEYAVLAELARHAGRVLTHAHLLRTVWGPAQADHIDYLRVAVRSLRQKLEPDPAHPALIVNQPAVGYRLATS